MVVVVVSVAVAVAVVVGIDIVFVYEILFGQFLYHDSPSTTAGYNAQPFINVFFASNKASYTLTHTRGTHVCVQVSIGKFFFNYVQSSRST